MMQHWLPEPEIDLTRLWFSTSVKLAKLHLEMGLAAEINVLFQYPTVQSEMLATNDQHIQVMCRSCKGL